MDENKMLESSTSALVASVSGNALALWSEDKKKEFVGTFKDRVTCARFILEYTAHEVARIALRRRFIGTRHWDKMFEHEAYGPREFNEKRFKKEMLVANGRGYSASKQYEDRVGGRDPKELYTIGEERAKEVLKSLPPTQEALNIIDPESAKMLDRIEELKAKGDKLKDLVEEASEPIVMSEIDQNMTIKAFRKMVKDQDERRRKYLQQMREYGKEGSELEAAVGKRLFKGLPGLSDAVMDVVQQHLDRSKALDATSRRVEEQVVFGDNEAALEMLKHFESDEATISLSVKASFAAALEKLKLSVKHGRKALKG